MTTKPRNMTKGKKPELVGTDKPGKSTNLMPPWKPGQVSNPRGRPIGSRSKFSEAMVSDFLADWHEHGTDVLARVRMTDPGAYLRVAAVLVPKEMNVSVEQRTPAGLDADDWERMIGLAKVMRDVAPDASLEQIEHALRSAFATEIEPVGSKAVAITYSRVDET